MTEQEFNMLMNKIDVILAIIGDDKLLSAVSSIKDEVESIKKSVDKIASKAS
jgi:hypothetical protein